MPAQQNGLIAAHPKIYEGCIRATEDAEELQSGSPIGTGSEEYDSIFYKNKVKLTRASPSGNHNLRVITIYATRMAYTLLALHTLLIAHVAHFDQNPCSPSNCVDQRCTSTHGGCAIAVFAKHERAKLTNR